MCYIGFGNALGVPLPIPGALLYNGFMDKEELTLKYVPLKTVIGWDTNTKKHDIPTLIRSIEKHGFRDPLSYDNNLNKGAGGIVEGNGRDLALKTMYAQNPKKPPRGISTSGGDWLVPVLFGLDAKSQVAAESYGIDHNLVGLKGGLNLDDMMKLYEEQTAQMIKGMQAGGAMPVSIDAQDLDAMLEADQEKLAEEEIELREKTMLRVLISIPVNAAMEAQPHIDELKKIIGVEVDLSGNG